jgi:activator of HSP90 ATPase
VETTSLKSCDGDVDVCQRKGKVISLYDVKVELGFKGKTADEDDISGQITIPEVAYDTEEDEFQFSITVYSDSASKEPVKVLLRKEIIPKLRKLLKAFGKDLIETHGKDIQHPDQAAPLQKPLNGAQPVGVEEKKVVGMQTYNTVNVDLKSTFTAPANNLYDAFTKPDMVRAWTRGSGQVTPEVGAEYSLFGGNITGEIVKLVPNKEIVMTWRLRDWKAEHFARLTLTFAEGHGETNLHVSIVGVPVGQEEVVENNFEEYYIRPIKLTFGFGAVL